jgi:HEAT repeat protein
VLTAAWLVELNQANTSEVLLATLALAGLLGWALYRAGVLGWVLHVVGLFIRGSIRQGFLLWEHACSWATWPVFFAVVAVLLLIGCLFIAVTPWLSLIFSLAVLLGGVTTCLAFMFIDLERYEVRRGYKAVHNPLKGQEPARYLPLYGHQVGVPLLVAACVSTVGGFALLNQSLSETVGAAWYRAGDGGRADFFDFLAYALINLYGIVDVLNLAESHAVLHSSYVKQAAWPASLLLTAFRSFFTLVLLQQLFASIRQGKLLAETIADFWSPHESIRERARNAIPEYGPAVLEPLLRSLRQLPSLTREQLDGLPVVLAAIGPAIIPALERHLQDEHEGVRGIAAVALGRLGALDSVGVLANLARDSSEAVRQGMVEALGLLGAVRSPGGPHNPWARRKWRVRGLMDLVRHPPAPALALPEGPEALLVGTLAGALADESAAVRAAAAAGLEQVGPRAAAVAPNLIERLKDPNETVRCRAAAALGQAGGEEEGTVGALADLLQDASPSVRAAAARALGALKVKAAPAVDALAGLLHDGDEGVRDAAAEAIAQVGRLEGGAASALAEGLASDDNLVRARTAEALGAIGAAAGEAAGALANVIDDKNDRVRAKAVEALGKMGEAAAEVAVPKLVRALRDPDNWVRALAAEALGEMGEAADVAVPALVRSLEHANPLVRGNAAEALGRMGSAAAPARAALVKAARDEEVDVRARAVRALGAIAPPTGMGRAAIRAALTDEGPTVRAAAVEACGLLDDEESAGRLLGLLEDANEEVRAATVRVLPRLAGALRGIVGGLCRRLEEDDSAAVREQAALALGKLEELPAEAVEALVRAARTAEEAVREQAMRTLAILQAPGAGEAFAAGLHDAGPTIRKVASAAWLKAGEVPEEVLPALVEVLRDSEPQVRANAAGVLARLEALPPGAVEPLVECTASPSDSLRAAAAMALRLAPGEEVVAVMERLLEDASLRVRLIAAGSILAARPDDERAAAVLREAAANGSPGVRRSAEELIEALGPKA